MKSQRRLEIPSSHPTGEYRQPSFSRTSAGFPVDERDDTPPPFVIEPGRTIEEAEAQIVEATLKDAQRRVTDLEAENKALSARIDKMAEQILKLKGRTK